MGTDSATRTAQVAWALCLLWAAVPSAEATNATNTASEVQEDMSVPEWVSQGGFIALLVAVYASLWGSALVCEDYFVPAMSRLCQRFEISDDMAGATLLAIGNSAPQLFISLVSIFVTSSSLGLGTAIGTVLFNHLFVCGVCVLNAQGGAIPLDWATLGRDCVFYLLSLVMLVWVLEGSFIEAVLGLQDTDQKNGQVMVHLDGAAALVGLYIVYVWVCGYYPTVLQLCGADKRRRRGEGCCVRMARRVWPSAPLGSEWTVLHQQDPHEAPLLAQDALGSSGSGFDILSFTDDLETAAIHSRLRASQRVSSVADAASGALSMRELRAAADETGSRDDCSEGMYDSSDARGSMTELSEEGDVVCAGDFMLDASTDLSQTSTAAAGGTRAPTAISGQYQCWLLKRSSFYSRLGIGSRKWQLRFFVLDDAGFRYMRTPGDTPHAKHINIFESSGVRVPPPTAAESSDETATLIFHVLAPGKTFTLRALTPEVHRRLVSILRRRLAIYQSYPQPLRHSMAELQGRARSGSFASEGDVRGQDKFKIDFVGDTTRTQSGRELSLSSWDGSPDEEGEDSDEEDFDETANVWDELAMYSDAAGSGRSATARDRARDAVEGASRSMTVAALRALGAFSRAAGQLLRPLKWAIRRSIPPVQSEDVDGESSPGLDGRLDDEGVSDNMPRSDMIRLRVNKRLRRSTWWNSVSLRLLCTILACLGWMVLLSYFLATSCVYLGHLLGLTSAVTGLTLVSAGTSFTNVLTSLIVCYQGQGAVAVSNAFGSNVFCILIGLGVPWLLAILVNGGRPYDSIQDDGVVASAVLLIFILAGFVVVLSSADFVLHRWMGQVMVAMYVVITAYLFIFATDGVFG